MNNTDILEVERSLIGGLLLNNDMLEEIPELKSNYFHNRVYGKVFDTMSLLINLGGTADPLTVADKVPEILYEDLINMSSGVFSCKSIPDYARIIRDSYKKREIREMVQKTLHELSESPPEEQISFVENSIKNILEGSSDLRVTSIREAASLAIALMGDREYFISTGFVDLDKLIGGLSKGNLIIIAGRPSMGKTAFALNISVNVAKSGSKVLFFSLEMSASELGLRVITQDLEITAETMQKNPQNLNLFKHEYNGNFFIDDSAILSTTNLRSVAKQIKRKHGLSLIVVDYLQLLRSPDGCRSENRVNEVASITRDLKAIAKELSVPVIALSQLSRSVEQRDNKHPQLSDLRDSGAIEQDADIVMFIFREDYYRRTGINNISEISVAKHRNGEVGAVSLRFDPKFTKFENLR